MRTVTVDKFKRINIIETQEDGVLKRVELSRDEAYDVAIELLKQNGFAIHGFIKRTGVC